MTKKWKQLKYQLCLCLSLFGFCRYLPLICRNGQRPQHPEGLHHAIGEAVLAPVPNWPFHLHREWCVYLSVFLGSICVIAVVSGRTLDGRRYPRRGYSEDDSTVTMKPSLCTHIASCQHRPEKFSKLAMNKFSVQSTRLARTMCNNELSDAPLKRDPPLHGLQQSQQWF